MAHRPLFEVGAPTFPVWDDYGAIGVGASRAHYVLAENGNEYIIKGPTFTPDHQYVAANELVAARIAGTLGLPVLDHAIIQMGGRFFFGGSWMQKPTFYPNTTSDLFLKCGNKDRIYDVLVFDVLVCNVDRHSGNLLVRRTKDNRHLLLMNDHSHCLVLPGESPSVLAGRVAAPCSPYLGPSYAREAITDPARLRQAIELLTSLEDDAILKMVQSMPDEFLSQSERTLYSTFLCNRRDRLGSLVSSSLTSFPRLKGSII